MSFRYRTSVVIVIPYLSAALPPPIPPRMRRTASNMGQEEYGSLPGVGGDYGSQGKPPLPSPRQPQPTRGALSEVNSFFASLDGSSDGDDWKASFMRAAKSVAEKMSSGMDSLTDESRTPQGVPYRNPQGLPQHPTPTATVLSSAWNRLQGRVTPQQEMAMKKSTSMAG